MLQEWTEPNSFNVCIAPYKQFFRGYASFMRVRWRCLVIDEMQRVRGMTERHWEAVFTLRRSDPHPPLGVLDVAGRGVCVTKLPLSNTAHFPLLCAWRPQVPPMFRHLGPLPGGVCVLASVL